MKSRVLWFILPFFLLSCGASKNLATTTKVDRDTSLVEKVNIVQYKPLQALNIEVGQTIEIPEVNLKVTRISESEAVVETKVPVVTQKQTEVQFIATRSKQIDRSKDKSVKDSNVNSKVKDKSQTDSNNKTKKSGNEKVKQNNKQVKRGFPWMIIIIIALFFLIGSRLVKRFSK